MRAIAALKSALKVSRDIQGSYVLAVAVTSPDPVRAARLSNAVADAYLVDKLDTRFEAAKRASAWLSDRLSGLRQQLRESEEMKVDRDYLARIAADLTAHGLTVSTELAMGDPATELIRLSEERGVDLLAMSTHGHRFLNDLVRGTTVNRVRHLVKIPVLLLRAQ